MIIVLKGEFFGAVIRSGWLSVMLMLRFAGGGRFCRVIFSLIKQTSSLDSRVSDSVAEKVAARGAEHFEL